MTTANAVRVLLFNLSCLLEEAVAPDAHVVTAVGHSKHLWSGQMRSLTHCLLCSQLIHQEVIDLVRVKVLAICLRHLDAVFLINAWQTESDF